MEYYLVDERANIVLNSFEYTKSGVSPYRLAAEYLDDCTIDRDLYAHRVSESVGVTDGSIDINNYALYLFCPFGECIDNLTMKRDNRATETMRNWFTTLSKEA